MSNLIVLLGDFGENAVENERMLSHYYRKRIAAEKDTVILLSRGKTDVSGLHPDVPAILSENQSLNSIREVAIDIAKANGFKYVTIVAHGAIIFKVHYDKLIESLEAEKKFWGMPYGHQPMEAKRSAKMKDDLMGGLRPDHTQCTPIKGEVSCLKVVTIDVERANFKVFDPALISYKADVSARLTLFENLGDPIRINGPIMLLDHEANWVFPSEDHVVSDMTFYKKHGEIHPRINEQLITL